jgi:hypothetical protein
VEEGLVNEIKRAIGDLGSALPAAGSRWTQKPIRKSAMIINLIK